MRHLPRIALSVSVTLLSLIQPAAAQSYIDLSQPQRGLTPILDFSKPQSGSSPIEDFSKPQANLAPIIDWSKPQTGKSKYALNSDLTPADLGVIIQDEAEASPRHDGPGCEQLCQSPAEEPKTVRVQEYKRRDGTIVSEHMRRAPRPKARR